MPHRQHIRKLPRNENQAYLLGEYAIDFLKNGNPSKAVLERVKLFHTDSVFTGISALALKTNAPTILKEEALEGANGVGNEVRFILKKFQFIKLIIFVVSPRKDTPEHSDLI